MLDAIFKLIPTKYLILFLIATILVVGFSLFFIIRKKSKIYTRIIFGILLLIYLIAVGFLGYYLNSFSSFINQVTTSSEIATEPEKIDVSKESFNIFLSGIDSRNGFQEKSLSDVNMVITVNPTTHQILLTGIPRDTYVWLHGIETDTRDKLTHAGVYGVEMSLKTVEDLLDTKIDYYVKIDFGGLISLVDSLGGIDIYSDASFTTDGCHFNEGETKTVDGKCALAFARTRKAYYTGDIHRVQNQQDVVSAIINKVSQTPDLILKVPEILESLKGDMSTNIPVDTIYAMLNHQIDQMPNWKILRYNVDGKGDMQYTYTYGGELRYVMWAFDESIQGAHSAINEILGKESSKETKALK